MSSVPYIFAGDTGNIPLSQLDANFANCKAFADTAGNVTNNVQANITSVGSLTSLSVVGNIASLGNIATSGYITGNGTFLSGVNLYTNSNVAAFLPTYAGNLQANNVTFIGNADMNANLNVDGSLSVQTSAIIYGNLTVTGTTTTANANTITTNDLTITVGNNQSSGTLLSGAGLLVGNSNIATFLYNNPTSSWQSNISLTPASNVTANLGANTRYWNNVFTANATVSGTITAPTPANTTSNTQLATTAFVRNIIPTGVIVMWSGSIASIPNGWYLCDGANSTPDLRDRFIVGAGSSYPVGITGGSANATLVSHTHTATVTDPGHFHTYIASTIGGTGGLTATNDSAPIRNTSTATTGITVANSTEGSSATNANLPPYYALAYIMKA
jgi:hypothetical protein